MKNKKNYKKLEDIGKILNMNRIDVAKSKRTIRNIICISIASLIISLVGVFFFTQNAKGLWYIPPSINDFNYFRGLF